LEDFKILFLHSIRKRARITFCGIL
jgi:hypothetical protein